MASTLNNVSSVATMQIITAVFINISITENRTIVREFISENKLDGRFHELLGL
jgi:hypothetical protein